MSAMRSFVERYYELMAAGDLDGLVRLYADDAMILTSSSVAATGDEIRALHESRLAADGGRVLRRIDDLRHTDDLVVWDAILDTSAGVMETTEVMVLDADGRIRRHAPLLDGYWGQ